MDSVTSMIQRFRQQMPTSHTQRQAQRQQGDLKEMWWMRKESLVSDDHRDEDYSLGSLASVPRPNGVDHARRWRSDEARRARQPRADNPTQSEFAVEKLMSEDVKKNLEAKASNTDVLSSPCPGSISDVPAPTSEERFPRRTLVPVLARHAEQDYATDTTSEAEDRGALRLSVTLEPRVYNGSAELRGGVITKNPTAQQDASRHAVQHGVDVPNEHRPAGDSSTSALGVAADLDVVLKRLRCGMDDGDQVHSPPESPSRGSLHITLGKIAYDLEAHLLEFTLVSNAREQAADEARAIEESEREAWREAETKRIENVVRQQNALGIHAADSDIDQPGDATWSQAWALNEHEYNKISSQLPFGSNGSEEELRRYRHHGHSAGLANSCSYPTCPPSRIGGLDARDRVSHIDSPVEAVAHKMSEILRTVEMKMKRIQALGDGEFHCKGNEVYSCAEQDSDGPANTSFLYTDDSSTEEPEATETVLKDVAMTEGALKDTVSVYIPRESSFSAGDEIPNDNPPRRLVTKGTAELSSVVHRNVPLSIQGKMARLDARQDTKLLASEFPDFQFVPRPWLYGHSTLTQTGQGICAELEVTMLCMQKRLAKTPTVGDKPDDNGDLADKRSPGGSEAMSGGQDQRDEQNVDGQRPVYNKQRTRNRLISDELDQEFGVNGSEISLLHGFSKSGGATTNGAYKAEDIDLNIDRLWPPGWEIGFEKDTPRAQIRLDAPHPSETNHSLEYGQSRLQNVQFNGRETASKVHYDARQDTADLLPDPATHLGYQAKVPTPFPAEYSGYNTLVKCGHSKASAPTLVDNFHPGPFAPTLYGTEHDNNLPIPPLIGVEKFAGTTVQKISNISTGSERDRGPFGQQPLHKKMAEAFQTPRQLKKTNSGDNKDREEDGKIPGVGITHARRRLRDMKKTRHDIIASIENNGGSKSLHPVVATRLQASCANPRGGAHEMLNSLKDMRRFLSLQGSPLGN